MMYRVPSWTLGKPLPRWILWIITSRLTVLVLSASVVPGLWQVTHSLVSWRGPPCSARWEWQLLQLAISTTSRVRIPVVAPDEGCHVYVALFVFDSGKVSELRAMVTRCVRVGTNGTAIGVVTAAMLVPNV